MSVVDDKTGFVWQGKYFRASRDRNVRKRFGCPCERNSKHGMGASHGKKGIIGVALADQRQMTGALFLFVKQIEAYPRQMILGDQSDRFRKVIAGRILGRTGKDPIHRRALREFFGKVVVGVEDHTGCSKIPKQFLFTVLVMLKIGMLVDSDVVGKEIGEEHRIKFDPGHALLHQRLRGDLDHNGLHSVFLHFQKRALQGDGIGSGVGSNCLKRSVANAIGADISRRNIIFVENMRQHLRRSGLSLGTGNADDLYGMRGIAVQPASQKSKGFSRVRGL